MWLILEVWQRFVLWAHKTLVKRVSGSGIGAITWTSYEALPLFATRFTACAGPWGYLTPFYAVTSPLDRYKMACITNILHRFIWMKFMSVLSMYNVSAIWDTQAFSLRNYCRFNTKSYCSDVCGYHWHSQTLAEKCRNMGICHGSGH